VAKNPEAYRDIPGYEGVPPPFVRCFPELLRTVGYYCTNNSKKDYQFKEPVTVWDQSSGKAHWRDRANGQPFFAVFNHNGTHESQAFPGSRRRPAAVDPAMVPLPPFYPDTPAVRDALARTYDNIAAMDGWVGRHLRELEDAGLLESTIVVFFSDHGVGLPRGKRSCYDTGTRVPLLVRFPDGRGAGTIDERVVSFVDFGPTMQSLAGLEPDPRLDGVPFLGPYAREGRHYAFAHADRFDAVYDRTRSVSDGRYRYVRNYLVEQPYLIANAYRERLPMTADLYALRERGAERPEQWQVAAKTRPAEEFYDSASDPWEVQNLIDAPEHRQRIDVMRRELDAWIADTGDLGFVLPETRLVQEKLWPPDGVQHTTPKAEVTTRIEVDGRVTVTIACADSGASIGYRTLEAGQDEGRGPWQVYSGPFAAAADARLEIQTHRIGHHPTTVEYLTRSVSPAPAGRQRAGGR
ncbi:MAG: sulfatase, partial [Planctomycetes bacterium]|nr:sulfatase [Planctomycetota bacterium]